MRTTVILFLLSALIFSCKKENSTQQNTVQNGVTSTLIVDDTAVANISHNSFNNGGKFALVVYGSGGNPEVQITFGDAQAPTAGQYLIISGTPSFGKCSFEFSNTAGTSTALSGIVTIDYNGGNTCSFTKVSVSGGAGNHRVTSNFTY